MPLTMLWNTAKDLTIYKPIVDIGPEFFVTVINFLILAFILYRVLYKPVLNMLARREEQIEGAIAGAGAEMDEALRLKAEYTELLAQSRTEAQTIIEKARKQGDQMVAAAETRAEQEAAAILERGRADLAVERESMLNEVRGQMAALAILAAEKLLEKNLDNDTNRKLVNDFVAKVGDD